MTTEEQEVTISFSRTDKYASIYASDTVYMRRLDKMVQKYPEDYTIEQKHTVDGEVVAKTYRVPKKYIRFGRHVEKPITDEQRAAAKERLQKYWEDKKQK